jgi:hypothetical protein
MHYWVTRLLLSNKLHGYSVPAAGHSVCLNTLVDNFYPKGTAEKVLTA